MENNHQLNKSPGKILSLAKLVDQFLEADLNTKALSADPKKIQSLKNLLDQTLWASSDLHTPIFDEDRLEAGNLIFLHRVLKGFWEKLKVEIKEFQKLQEERDRVRTIQDAKEIARKVRLGKANWEALGPQYFDEVHRERFSQIKIKLPKELDVTFTFEAGKVQAFYGGMDALFAFVNLVNGIPVDFFRQCKDEKCGRWFVLTSKHKRMFCNHLCAARFAERMKRERDPEKFKEYHRGYYHKNLQ